MGISLNPGTLLNGNGINVSTLISESLAPLNSEALAYQQQQSTLQGQSSLLTSISSDLSSLSSAVNALTDPLGALSGMAAHSSQSSIVTGSAQSGATAGSHTIVVSSLASQSTVYTEPVASATTSILPSSAQSASLSFQVGGSSGATHSVAISSGTNDTLNSLVSYINSQNWGVTATVLTDSTGSRLALYSNTTGTTGAIAITANSTAMTFNTPVGGTNATFTVDGIPFSSTSNTVSGAIPGVTLSLLGAYPDVQVQLSVAPDAVQAEQAIGAFVSAYNSVVGDLNTQFTVDPSTNSEGPLAGDNSLRSLQSSLLTDAAYAAPQSTLYTNTVKTADSSILPSGAQSAEIQLQVGGSSGSTYDIAISPGINDTPNSLASYINQQGWGVKAAVVTGSGGVQLKIFSDNSNSNGALDVTSNTSNLIFNPAVGSSYTSLRSLGITMNNDGTLSINSTQLNSAVTADPASVLNFFQNAAQTGFANNFASDLQNLTDPTQGILNMDLAQNQTQQQGLADSITNLQDQIRTLQQQLQTEFSQVNAVLESFPYELQAIQTELGLTPINSSNTVTG